MAVETKPQKLKRLAKELRVRREKRGNLLRRAEQHAKRIKLVRETLIRLRAPTTPGIQGGWHAQAIRNQVHGGIGAFLNVPAKLVWHTTEGSSLPGYSGSHPHFTLDFKRRLLYQHVPVTSGAMALANASGGVETNRAHAIQVELVGFSDAGFAARVGKTSHAVGNWTDSDYAQIAALARWVEKHCDVERQCSVTFHNDSSHKVRDWPQYSGHIGHQHVPENFHWDPSAAFRIDKVI
jgi:hypothetical protein